MFYTNLNFPLILSNVIIPPGYLCKLSCVYLFEFPAQIINVIIPPSLSMSAVARASPSCRASIYLNFPLRL